MVMRCGMLMVAGFFCLSPFNIHEVHDFLTDAACAEQELVPCCTDEIADKKEDLIETSNVLPSCPPVWIDNKNDEIVVEKRAEKESLVELNNTDETALTVDLFAQAGDLFVKEEVLEPSSGGDADIMNVTENVPEIPRLVSVTIDILKAQQKYKHWTGFSYTPDIFYCVVNDVKMMPGEVLEVPVEDNKVVITYYSRFENGRESSKKYTYILEPVTKKIAVQFDWKRKVRIFLDDESAQFESLEELM